MKKLVEVKNKTWGETSEGKHKKQKNNNVGLGRAESFWWGEWGAFINNNRDIPWWEELRVKATGGNTQTKR